jgi:hypothetical protein
MSPPVFLYSANPPSHNIGIECIEFTDTARRPAGASAATHLPIRARDPCKPWRGLQLRWFAVTVVCRDGGLP